MRYAPVTDRLADLGSAKWAVHYRARELERQGREVILLTIGEPDVNIPETLIDVAARAMHAGRTGYSDGRGEAALLDALSARYTERLGRPMEPQNFVAFPGTQTALYAVLMAMAHDGCEVLVGDPMYATYEGVIAACGATPVAVPLRPEQGFRIQPADLEAAITPATRVIFLNTPHNPTGAVLRRAEVEVILDLARAHDLWVLSDEVYEDLVFGPEPFISPFALDAERVVVTNSLSKSHAAAGFRTGWCAGPAEFCARVLPLAETMLFGNQPFIADMTAAALREPDLVAAGLRQRLGRRLALVQSRLDGVAGLRVHPAEAGMFALIDTRGARDGGADAFAHALVEATGVAVMPGTSFGAVLDSWIRISLTVDDAVLERACDLIAGFAGATPAPVAVPG